MKLQLPPPPQSHEKQHSCLSLTRVAADEGMVGDKTLNLSQCAIALLLSLAAVTGCSRERYRVRADLDAYSLIGEKTVATPWDSLDFQIETDADSRLSHGSCIDDPQLPDPTPALYTFRVPPTPVRSPSRFFGSAAQTADFAEELPDERFDANVVQATYVLEDSETQDPSDAPPPTPEPDGELIPRQEPSDGNAATADDISSDRPIVPINREAWDSIPKNCLVRVIEFKSIREEYRRTYEVPVPDAMFDPAEKLALEDLLQLAVKHSREYQTAKEALYRTSLRLSLERFAFQTKFTTNGNGTAIAWQQLRSGGLTDDTVGINSGAALDRVLTNRRRHSGSVCK